MIWASGTSHASLRPRDPRDPFPASACGCATLTVSVEISVFRYTSCFCGDLLTARHATPQNTTRLAFPDTHLHTHPADTHTHTHWERSNGLSYERDTHTHILQIQINPLYFPNKVHYPSFSWTWKPWPTWPEFSFTFSVSSVFFKMII